MDLQAIANDTAHALTMAGLPTVTDPRDLTLPGAIIGPETITFPTLGDRVNVEWTLYLVAPDNGTPLATLSPLITALRDSGTMPDQAELTITTITFPNLSPDPLPSITYRLTTTTTD